MANALSTPQITTVVADTDDPWLEEAKYVAEHSVDEEIVVDISAVKRIRSAELNQLIRLHLDIKHQGRILVLENAQPQVWEIFTLTRLNRLIEIRDPQKTT